jgi:hypothetical protein
MSDLPLSKNDQEAANSLARQTGSVVVLNRQPEPRSRLIEVISSGLFLLASLSLAAWTFNPVRLERERLAAQIEFMEHLQEHGFKMEVK